MILPLFLFIIIDVLSLTPSSNYTPTYVIAGSTVLGKTNFKCYLNKMSPQMYRIRAYKTPLLIRAPFAAFWPKSPLFEAKT